MRKVQSLDIIVGLLAGISCLLIYINIPVWALFIGWAWYYYLGSDVSSLKKAVPSMVVGALLAMFAFVLIDIFLTITSSMVSTILAVIITVILLMLSLKISVCNVSLISFNAYSCFFAGYGLNAYMKIEAMPSLLNAFIWIVGANFLGLIFGWLSISINGSIKRRFNSQE